MTIGVSTMESYEFGKHFGKTKQDFLSNGDGLSSSSVLNGIVRGFSDNIVISLDTFAGEVIFGWVFSEDCLLLSGGIACTNAVIGSGPIITELFNGTTRSADWIGEIIPEFPTDVVGSTQLLTDEQSHFIDKGTAVGFSQHFSVWPVLQGVKLSYYFTYMSDL